MQPSLPSLCDTLLPIAEQAGREIMRYYRGDIDVIIKDDGSPTTAADAAAEKIIVEYLKKLTPSLPIVAEEEASAGLLPSLIDGASFWLVDPLDGTKEFIHKRDEFTVNIALIQEGIPVLGIVYAPALQLMYYGYENTAYKLTKGGLTQRLQPVPHDTNALLNVAASRSHMNSDAFQDYFGHWPLGEVKPAGSSLKFCLVADGAADIYPRTGPTMSWDTAAGDAVLRAAGGHVFQFNGHPLPYPAPNFKNPPFVALSGGVHAVRRISFPVGPLDPQ